MNFGAPRQDVQYGTQHGRGRRGAESKRELDDEDLQEESERPFDLKDAKSHRDLLTYGRPMTGPGRSLRFRKKFKPSKHATSLFLWGRARPRSIFPENSNQATPFRHQELSVKRFVNITAAKDGTHAFGYTVNDMTFVWGETDTPASLGLGREVRSSPPFVIRQLRKKNVRQVACSSRHTLVLTDDSEVFAWGAQELTGLSSDVNVPTPCTFLAGKDITGIAAGTVHSAAWTVNSTNLYTWGMSGSWLGFDEDARSRSRDVSCTFGKVPLDRRVTEQGNIVKVACGEQFTMVMLDDGRVLTFGVNEHGRMGVGEHTHETVEPIVLFGLPPIGDVSVANLHSAFVSEEGQVFTCGIGSDYRLGHSSTDTEWTPRLVEALGPDAKIVRVECVLDRTFAITEYGCVLMWGCEPVTNLVHTAPFVLEYLRPYRIYQLAGAYDFTVALGVETRDPVPKPHVTAYDRSFTRVGANQMDDAIGQVAEVMGGLGMGMHVLPGGSHFVTQTFQNEMGQSVAPPSTLQPLFGQQNQAPFGPGVGNMQAVSSRSLGTQQGVPPPPSADGAPPMMRPPSATSSRIMQVPRKQ